MIAHEVVYALAKQLMVLRYVFMQLFVYIFILKHQTYG